MTFDAFAEMAQRREVRVFGRPYPLETRSYVLGLLGDAGEVADRITKIAGDVDGNVSLSSRRAVSHVDVKPQMAPCRPGRRRERQPRAGRGLAARQDRVRMRRVANRGGLLCS
jgi:hypothetical protein